MKPGQKRSPELGRNRGQSEREGSATGGNLTTPRPLRQCCVCGCHFPRRQGTDGDLVCTDCDRETERWEDRRA